MDYKRAFRLALQIYAHWDALSRQGSEQVKFYKKPGFL